MKVIKHRNPVTEISIFDVSISDHIIMATRSNDIYQLIVENGKFTFMRLGHHVTGNSRYGEQAVGDGIDKFLDTVMPSYNEIVAFSSKKEAAEWIIRIWGK